MYAPCHLIRAPWETRFTWCHG